jgi:hypothetical protein
VTEEPALIARSGDPHDHVTACHFPVEEGEQLARETASIVQQSTEPTLPSA